MRMRALLLLGSAAALVGCGRPRFPTELFTVEAPSADYPVMASKGPPGGGRRLHASSGTHHAQQTNTYSFGRTQVSVTTVESGKSELSASEKIAAQVSRRDRWVQLAGATFTAVDFSTINGAQLDRTLDLEMEAHK